MVDLKDQFAWLLQSKGPDFFILLLVQRNLTNRKRAACSHSGANWHSKIEDCGHSDAEDQSISKKERSSIQRPKDN